MEKCRLLKLIILLVESSTEKRLCNMLVNAKNRRLRVGNQSLNSGKVVAVGPGLHDKAGNRIPIAVKEGDTVLLPEYGSTQVMLGEKEFHLYQDEDILRTLHN
ncbi:10 kDa chaperonin [Capsicum chinense]|nr:10 kDa chaperonin [Capsicum chinense]